MAIFFMVAAVYSITVGFEGGGEIIILYKNGGAAAGGHRTRDFDTVN
jgi:hypothetical protein